jgi:hypothetical protein
MSETMLIRDLFVSDVKRDIPPVVYFHEQSPKKLHDEVSEYIITGGWPQDHPNHQRVPDGIHEQYVRLLNAIASELDKKSGPDLPNVWISGFYGSGKSSFAKLLGLALDGVALPDGTSLADALLRRDTSPRADELRKAWDKLRRKIDPIAVVFDIGGIAQDNEQLHAAAVRQLQSRLGYCSTDAWVADFELKLERGGQWSQFTTAAEQTLGHPWDQEKDKPFAEEAFSQIMHVMDSVRYTDPMSWFTSRAGTHQRLDSPSEAVAAISDMLKFRRPGATLFMVVDEVSQYVLSNRDRVDRMRAFASELGARLKGQAWLLALGQQRIDEEAGDSFLIWAKDRFPQHLRVHLSATNIRDVVHRRLLQKDRKGEDELRARFEKHRPELKLYAFGCEDVSADAFVEVYPMLPGQIDLLLQITSALRTRSARAQGDDQAIRGLLQLLGELFRNQELADRPVGDLVTLDQIYEVQHTALDSDVQSSMARILHQCAADDPLLIRAAKAVSLLELIQDTVPTDAKFVSQCLYDRLDRGNQVADVTEALEELRRRNLLSFSEKQGYRVQSTAGEEWERERREITAPRESISEIVEDALKFLLDKPERPKMKGRAFPWAGVYSDGREKVDAKLLDPRDDAAFRVDFRFLPNDDRSEATWVKRSAETALENRLVWVCGDTEQLAQQARELIKSKGIVKKYQPRRESLSDARRILLQSEELRTEELQEKLQDEVAAAWMSGNMYFRERKIEPTEHGSGFATTLKTVAERLLSDLFFQFDPITVLPAELAQLLEADLSGPSPKFLKDELGILELDAGRYVPTCSGVIPRRILERIEKEDGTSGGALISNFAGPPFGYTPEVVKACVLGLLRASKLQIETEDGTKITAPRDAGVRDVFDKVTSFRRATLLPSGDDDIGVTARAKICKFFEDSLHDPFDREDSLIADSVQKHFPNVAKKLRDVLRKLDRLPGSFETPSELTKLSDALEQCLLKVRETKPTVQRVKKHLDALRDGVQLLNICAAELTDEAVQAVREAAEVLNNQVTQLRAVDALSSDVDNAAKRIDHQLQARRPWTDIASLAPDLLAVRQAYIAQRQRLLELQEQQAEQARGRVQSRDGFSTLTSDQAHTVLRPVNAAVTDTSAAAIAPALSALKDAFVLTLQRGEDRANELLDDILSEGERPMIVKVDLTLHNREVTTEAEVEELVKEIRERLLEQVRSGQRVRLI